MTNNPDEIDPKIQVASNFFDQETADEEIARVLQGNSIELQAWLAGQGAQLTLLGRAHTPLGMVLVRGDLEPEIGTGLKIVLRRRSELPAGYHVHVATVMR